MNENLPLVITREISDGERPTAELRSTLGMIHLAQNTLRLIHDYLVHVVVDPKEDMVSVNRATKQLKDNAELLAEGERLEAYIRRVLDFREREEIP